MKTTYISTRLNRYTFEVDQVRHWVESRCKGKTLNLFAGKVKLKLDEYRVDLNEDMLADEYCDAYEFIEKCDTFYDTILLDPPYAYRKAMEMYEGRYTTKFKKIADLIHEKNLTKRVISFGYHSAFMGRGRLFDLEELCVFGHGGLQHCTIAIVEEKLVDGQQYKDTIFAARENQ